MIVPDLMKHRVRYFREIGEGRIEEYLPEQTLFANDFRGESNKINGFIDKKVIFIPLRTVPESEKCLNFKEATGRILLEFEVSKIDSATGIEKIVSRTNAEIYNPFTKKDAKRVSHFVRRYIYQTSRLRYK
jgi:hypothetical protein